MALTRITKGVIKPNENYDTHNINSTGIVTAVGANFTGDVNVGGVLTYEDVTSIDSVGIITAQQGIHVGAGISVVGVGSFGTVKVGSGVTIEANGQIYTTGITTTTENFYIKPDTQQNRGIYIGSNEQLRLQYTGGANQSYLRSSAAFLSIASNNVFIQRYDTNYTMASFRAGQQCKLTYNYVDRIATSGIGATVYGQLDTTDLDVDGHTNLDNVSIAGVTTMTGNLSMGETLTVSGNNPNITFTDTNSNPDYKIYGSNGAFTILDSTNGVNRFAISSTGNISLSNDLDVDGHTNLDNVSVAGVSTFTGNADFSAGVDVTGMITATGEIRSQDDIRIQSVYPRLYLTDTDSNDDFSLINNNGSFLIYNDTQNDFRLKIDGTTGQCAMNLRPTVDSNFNLGTNTLRWANVYADTYYGDGSNLTGITGTTINNNANNRVITGSGTANTLEGESGLLFDGTDTLEMGTAAGGSGYDSNMKLRIGRGSDCQICVRNTGGDTNYGGLIFGDQSSSFGGGIQYHHNGNSLRFYTNNSTTEKLRIDSAGSLRVGDNSSFSAHTAADDLVVGTTSGSNGMTILTGSATGNIFFNDGSGNDGVVQYVHSSSPNYMRIASSGHIRFDAARISISDDNIAPTAGDMASGASFGIPRLHMRGDNAQSGAYELMARFQSGNDSDNSGATIVLNHSNDRGLALQGGRDQSNRSFGAIRAVDNLGRLSNCIQYVGGNGQGVNRLEFYTGESSTTTQRLKIDASGNFLVGDGATYTAGSHVHLHGGTSGVQQLRVQNHTSIGSFSGNYGSEFRHATSAANHAMLIHCQENQDSRRTLDISDYNGIFASFTNHKMGLGTGITSPPATLYIRTTDDDDAIRLVNTSTGNNGIQWWNEYGGATKRVSMDYGEGDANFDIACFRGDAQDNRPYGNVRILTGSYSSPNVNFRVTTLGSVHMPNQPSFSASDSSGHVYGGNPPPRMVFNNPDFNVGNNYDTSTGIFTAPIAGKYQFSFCGMAAGGPGDFQVRIRKNGGSYFNNNGSGRGYGTFEPYGFTVLMDLAINDEVDITIYSSNTNAYIYAGSSWNRFSGYLIG